MKKMLISSISKFNMSLGKLSALLIVPMVVSIVYATCKRYFFDSMPSWGYEVPIFLYGIHFLLGGVQCQLTDKHVNVDILPKYVSEKNRKRLNCLSNFVILFSCFLVAVYAVSWAYDSILINERSVHNTDFNPTVWWFKCFVPLSFFLVAIQAFVNMAMQATDKKIRSE